jgi:hypothetical protein
MPGDSEEKIEEGLRTPEDVIASEGALTKAQGQCR